MERRIEARPPVRSRVGTAAVSEVAAEDKDIARLHRDRNPLVGSLPGIGYSAGMDELDLHYVRPRDYLKAAVDCSSGVIGDVSRDVLDAVICRGSVGPRIRCRGGACS